MQNSIKIVLSINSLIFNYTQNYISFVKHLHHCQFNSTNSYHTISVHNKGALLILCAEKRRKTACEASPCNIVHDIKEIHLFTEQSIIGTIVTRALISMIARVPTCRNDVPTEQIRYRHH